MKRLHESTFKYLKPTEGQLVVMDRMRGAFHDLAMTTDAVLPNGQDKDFVMLLLRTAAMWANVSILDSRMGRRGPKKYGRRG